MSAVNTLGHNVEQLFDRYGFIPVSAQPHDTPALAKAEFDALVGQTGERRVYEALALHPKEAARIALARAAVLPRLAWLNTTPARADKAQAAINSGATA